jgi:hypothetical protein
MSSTSISSIAWNVNDPVFMLGKWLGRVIARQKCHDRFEQKTGMLVSGPNVNPANRLLSIPASFRMSRGLVRRASW